MPGEHVLRREVADGAVQAGLVVMVFVTLILLYPVGDGPQMNARQGVSFCVADSPRRNYSEPAVMSVMAIYQELPY